MSSHKSELHFSWSLGQCLGWCRQGRADSPCCRWGVGSVPSVPGLYQLHHELCQGSLELLGTSTLRGSAGIQAGISSIPELLVEGQGQGSSEVTCGHSWALVTEICTVQIKGIWKAAGNKHWQPIWVNVSNILCVGSFWDVRYLLNWIESGWIPCAMKCCWTG